MNISGISSHTQSTLSLMFMALLTLCLLFSYFIHSLCILSNTDRHLACNMTGFQNIILQSMGFLSLACTAHRICFYMLIIILYIVCILSFSLLLLLSLCLLCRCSNWSATNRTHFGPLCEYIIGISLVTLLTLL